MSSKPLQPVVDWSRRALSRAARWPGPRRVMFMGLHELARALDDSTYGGAYFGAGRDPFDRMGLSGYERYDRDTSNANVAAYLVWRFFGVHRALDVGCATGFVVEALRELAIDADGVDVSQYAVDHPAKGAHGHLQFGDLLTRLPFERGEFELVTALEVLEHLPPEKVPRALRELRRVTRGFVVATIPSFGPNRNGPGGWYQVKVRDERVPYYEAFGPEYEGPIAYDDLYRDARGEPIEGHLTIASFGWWTRRFEEAGFVRCDDVERRIHPHLARFNLTKYWNLYVFRLPDVPEPLDDAQPPSEIERVEHMWKLDERTPLPEDLEAVESVLGPFPES